MAVRYIFKTIFGTGGLGTKNNRLTMVFSVISYSIKTGVFIVSCLHQNKLHDYISDNYITCTTFVHY